MVTVAVVVGVVFFVFLACRRRLVARLRRAPVVLDTVPIGVLPARRRDPEDGGGDRGGL